MIKIRKGTGFRPSPKNSHPWKQFIPERFKSHSDVYHAYLKEGKMETIKRSMHKSGRGQEIKGCGITGTKYASSGGLI